MDKKYIKNVLIYILSGVLSILGIGYIAYHLSGGSVVELPTEIMMETEMEHSVTADGLLVRSELPISGGGSDVCGMLSDGENAGVGQQVMWVFSGAGGIGDKIRSIEFQIRVLQDSLVQSNMPTALDKNAKDLKQSYERLLSTLGAGSLEGLDKVTTTLQTCINKNKNSQKTRQAIEQAIVELENERKALLEANKAGVTTLTAPEAGLFYGSVDGFESLLSGEAATKMTYADYLSYCERVKNGEKANDGVCKVVTDAYWYVCLALDNTVARELMEGQIYSLTFPENDNQKIEMTLHRMESAYGEKQSLLVFGTRSVPAEFDFSRIQKVSLVTKTYTGFRVPAQAVRYVDGKVGVYITDGNKVRFRRIEVLMVGDGNCIVAQHDTTKEGYTDMLRLYDKVILSGKELYDGKYLD